MRSKFRAMRYSTYLYVLIRHANVICIGCEILRRCHDGKLNGPFVSEGLIGPFSYGSDFFHRRDAIVCDEHLDSCASVRFLTAAHLPPTYPRNDGMTVMTGNKVLHRPRGRYFQMVTADEMRC